MDSAPAGLRLKEVCSQGQLSKTTAFRLLAHRERERYLFRDSSGAYSAGPKLLRLGCRPAQHMVFRKASRPVLQNLRDLTQETVNLGILVGQDVFYVDVVQSPNPFPMISRIGMFRPLYCTAMGKALVSSLASAERERLLSSLCFYQLTQNTITEASKFNCEIQRISRAGICCRR